MINMPQNKKWPRQPELTGLSFGLSGVRQEIKGTLVTAWEFLRLELPSRSGVRRHEAHEKMIASLAEHQMSLLLITDPARASDIVPEQSALIQPALNDEIWRATHGR